MIESFIQNIDSLVLAFVQGSYSQFGSLIVTLWRSMFIIFIAVFGYKVILSGRFSSSDLIVNCLKIIFVLALATQWPLFQLFVYDTVTDMPSDLAGLLIQAASHASGAGASNTVTANQALSSFYDRAMSVTDQLLQGAGFRNFSLYLYALIVWLSALALTAYAAMLIILSKLAVAILLAIGPFFILLLVFNQTRSLFEGWLRTLLNYALIPVFVYALLALLLVLAESPLTALENNTSAGSNLLSYITPFMFTGIVSALLLAQIMNIAGSVTGGLSLSTLGTALWGSRSFYRGGQYLPRVVMRTPKYISASLGKPIRGLNVAKTRFINKK